MKIPNISKLLSILIMYLVLGCNANGVYACQNGGFCLSKGVCECSSSFNGTFCEKCK